MKNAEVENFHYWTVLVGRARGGRKTGQVAERIDFTIISPYFILEKAKSGLKTILSAWQVGQTGVSSGEVDASAHNCHGHAPRQIFPWLWTDPTKS